MNDDTRDFLETVIWHCEEALPPGLKPDDFSAEFIAGAESFVDGFRNYLTATSFDMRRLDLLERSFGGNVYLSLSGAGAGFFDDADDAANEIEKHLKDYSRHPERFYELYSDLEFDEKTGKIDLARFPRYLPEAREKLFNTQAQHTK